MASRSELSKSEGQKSTTDWLIESLSCLLELGQYLLLYYFLSTSVEEGQRDLIYPFFYWMKLLVFSDHHNIRESEMVRPSTIPVWSATYNTDRLGQWEWAAVISMITKVANQLAFLPLIQCYQSTRTTYLIKYRLQIEIVIL